MLAAGCAPSGPPEESLVLATTTSTQDSGLLDVLVPIFERQANIKVKVVAVGTGQALELGRRGDADVLLVHDPASEEKFIAEGYGVDRREVMHNDFVLVGPKDDPAQASGAKTAATAFGRIANQPSPFVSRGDESGTHQKEKEIWRQAKIEPRGAWYLQAGSGMGQVLRIANEKRAYTLCDRATFLPQRAGLDLDILLQGDPTLVNRYHVIVVNPEKHSHVHSQAARKFSDFLLSPEGQKAIAEFGRDRYGQALFFVEVHSP
ncbi:MAG TPA: substrate-binding domain-containing protein [Gemmataceae bacterium]|nr:substrate-binding domain-containing protein [Gemmataceae bacterium]